MLKVTDQFLMINDSALTIEHFDRSEGWMWESKPFHVGFYSPNCKVYEGFTQGGEPCVVVHGVHRVECTSLADVLEEI